jgi:HB1, ASXL, restriction endonuclease HTH domain
VNTTDAAVEVLRRHDGGPMKAADLAERVLASGLVSLAGKTPKDTILARVYVEAKKPNGKIERVGTGTFRLRER